MYRSKKGSEILISQTETKAATRAPYFTRDNVALLSRTKAALSVILSFFFISKTHVSRP